MPARLLDRVLGPALTDGGVPPGPPRAYPEAGYDALARLTHLRDRLIDAGITSARTQWKEPPVFFFNCRQQAEYQAAHPVAATADSTHEICDCIASELPLLFASVEVRRVARGIDGLRQSAERLAPTSRAVKDLADLLAVPDDEVVLLLSPERRAGFRLAIRGVADVGQLHILMADALAGDPLAGFLPGPAIPARLVAACRDVNPATPAGVPMLVHARWQLYSSAALRRDSSSLAGMEGCNHWLWPSNAMASLPRIDGERILLMGKSTFAATWEVARRFPELPAELRVIEALSPFRVAERLSCLSGQYSSAAHHREPPAVLAKAA